MSSGGIMLSYHVQSSEFLLLHQKGENHGTEHMFGAMISLTESKTECCRISGWCIQICYLQIL